MRNLGLLVVLAIVLGIGSISVSIAQPKAAPAEPVKASAFKLPDGTIVFVARGLDDLDPAIDRVLLTPQEYKTLLEQLNEAKKAKEAAMPSVPSGCAIQSRIEMRGERNIAAITATFTFRTTAPRTVMMLGCQRAAVSSAKSANGKLPILISSPDAGLSVLVETAGEHTVTVELEAPITGRGTRGELGFEIGLPRSAVTTFVLDHAPNKVKQLTIGTRIAEAATGIPMIARPPEIKRTTWNLDQLANKTVPLGATDVLELTWEPPSSATTSIEATLTAETDLAVRVDETQVETIAKIRLHGNAKEWSLHLPMNADVFAERIVPGASPMSPIETPAIGPAATVLRPKDPTKPIWAIRTPNDTTTADWLVTVAVRQTRPKSSDPKFRGPYAIGPFSIPTATRHSGKVRVHAPASVRVGYKPHQELRRQDLPLIAEDDLVGLFQFASVPVPGGNNKPPVWLELDLRPSVALARVRPTHRLSLTPAGWRLQSTVRITPPARGELDQIQIELPAAFQSVEAGPDGLVDEIVELKQNASTTTLSIRFRNPLRAMTELTLSATLPAPGVALETSIGLPQFSPADEREAKVQVSVPDGLEVRATASPWDATQPSQAEPLKAVAVGTKPSATTLVSGDFERGVGRVDIAWQTYRPELLCSVRGEVTIQDRQFVVSQVFQFRSPGEDAKAIRFRGPAVVGLQSTPPLEPIGPNEWELRPPPNTKEFRVVLGYAVRQTRSPDQAAGSNLAVPMLWPESATRVDTVLRIWGSGVRRAERFIGPWRELPMEPAADREALPWFTLSSTGTSLPLSLEIPEAAPAPAFMMERGLMEVIFGNDGQASLRARYLIHRWAATDIDVELPPGSFPEFFFDGKKIDPLVLNGANEPRIARVHIGEVKTARSFSVLELRQQSLAARGPRRERVFTAPTIQGIAFRTPLRWHFTTQAGTTALFTAPEFQPEIRWGWRGTGMAPVAASTPSELDQWFTEGTDLDAAESGIAIATEGDTLCARQLQASHTIEIYFLPRAAWATACSAVVFVVGFMLSRLRVRWLGPVLGLLGAAFVLFAIRFPQPLTQLIAGTQYGILMLLVVLASSASLRWWARRRIERLPAFSRTQVPSVIVTPPTPSKTGSATASNAAARPSAYVQLDGSAFPLSPKQEP